MDTIIRLEREREKTAAPVATAEVSGDHLQTNRLSLVSLMQDEDEESDRLKPYKKDLEYLDDHFQLIAYKLKAKSMDKRMEQEVFYSLCWTIVVTLNRPRVMTGLPRLKGT